ncbi:MAG: LuxR C-terminal-related transcriptional regulator [Phycisphaerales bacterium JB054]
MDAQIKPELVPDAVGRPGWRTGTSSVLFDALTADTTCAVAVLHSTGRILDCNTACAHLLAGSDRAEVIDTPLTRFLTPAIGDVHRDAQKRTLLFGQPVLIDGPFARARSLATYRLLDTSGPSTLLLTLARWTPTHRRQSQIETITISAEQCGPLASLSEKELFVLRGIATGFSSAQIAEAMQRSIKTVERHRVSLGSKLHVRTRVELANIAWLWGIEPLGACQTSDRP